MNPSFSLEPRVYVAPSMPISGPRSVTINPLKFKAAILIAQVSDGWLQYSTLADLSPTTIINRASAIRSLGNFLTQESDRALTMNVPIARLTDRLYEWERHQIETQSKTSQRPQKLATDLKNFVKAYLVGNDIENSVLQRWTDSRPLIFQSDRVTDAALNEFSNAERLLIERAFKDVIRAGEAFLELGDRLLREGKNPQEHGWETLPNIVWGLKHLAPEQLPNELWQASFQSKYWKEILGAARGLEKHRQLYFGNLLIGLLYPHMMHLQAIQSLLMLKTGWSPEEVGSLTMSDVLVEAQKVRVRTTKNRAHRTRYRELPRSSSSSGWSSGDLVVRCIAAMKHTTSNKNKTDLLWIGALTSRGKGDKRFLGRLASSPQFSFGKLISACDIEITRPHDRRRLRKTTLSAKAVLLGTLAGSAGDDHSIEVFRNHYAQTTTVHTIAAHTVLSAQRLVMNRIGPTVIPISAAHLESDQLSGSLSVAVEETKNEGSADKQLSITACSDPTNPPGAPGTLCLDAPRKCLECRNAVIFAEHLPRLLTYRALLKDIEKAMPPRQFSAVYGQQVINIDAAIAKLPVPTSKPPEASVMLPLTMRTKS